MTENAAKRMIGRIEAEERLIRHGIPSVLSDLLERGRIYESTNDVIFDIGVRLASDDEGYGVRIRCKGQTIHFEYLRFERPFRIPGTSQKPAWKSELRLKLNGDIVFRTRIFSCYEKKCAISGFMRISCTCDEIIEFVDGNWIELLAYSYRQLRKAELLRELEEVRKEEWL